MKRRNNKRNKEYRKNLETKYDRTMNTKSEVRTKDPNTILKQGWRETKRGKIKSKQRI